MPVRNCAICGKEFDHWDSRVVTCGDPECIRMRKVLYNRERRKASCMAKLATLPVRYCPICGTPFKTANYTQQTCGDKACMAEHVRRYDATKRKPRQEMTCPICGKPFKGRVNQRTCGNRKCYDKLYMIEAEASGRPAPPAKKPAVVVVRHNLASAIDTMPCPWATGKLDTLPPGVRSWDDPIMCFDGRGWTDGVWIETNEIAEVRAA